MVVEEFVPIFPTPTILPLFVVSIDHIFTIFGTNMNKLLCISCHVFGETTISVSTLLQGVHHSGIRLQTSSNRLQVQNSNSKPFLKAIFQNCLRVIDYTVW